jgi:hypothetical protein
MTDDNREEWTAAEEPVWEPKTPLEQRAPLNNAPLASLNAAPASSQAFTLMSDLAKRYPRPQGAKGKAYARNRTLVDYANAGGAFVADLLAAAAQRNRSEGWLRCSHNKSDYTGQYVSWAMFNGVRSAWLEAGLIEHKQGYPGMLAFGNPGPRSGKLTRYRATPQLFALCAEHGVTAENVTQRFRFEYKMPGELVQLTSPNMRTPTNSRTEKLREEVAELNEFFAQHTLSLPTIKHIGWVRKFHLGNHPDFKWNKGGRMYSFPPGAPVNYQNVDEDTRLEMKIDDQQVVEIDISSSYLSIFYAWNDQQLDTEQDAYRDILGPSDVDRQVAKFWINASFGNSDLLTKWTTELKNDLQDTLIKKKLCTSAFDAKPYPMKLIREKALQRHPLLERWGGKIRGRVRDYGDLITRRAK